MTYADLTTLRAFLSSLFFRFSNAPRANPHLNSVVSLETPLHRYPMHAMTVLAAEAPTWEQVETTAYLQTLAQAHSRAVLLIQNIVHSTAEPVSPEAASTVLRSAPSSSTNLKELVFPAPLSYFDSGPTTSSSLQPNSSKRRPSPSGSSTRSPSSYKAPRSRTAPASLDGHSRQSSSSSLSLAKKAKVAITSRSTRRLSVFFGGSPQRPTPPPQQEPASLRYYSGSWRQSYYVRSPAAADSAASLGNGVADLKPPPKTRFARESRYSSDSSLGSSAASPARRSRQSHPRRAGTKTPPSPSSSPPQQPPPSTSSSPWSLHSLEAAAARNRAPILRVFAPCAVLTEEVIAACEDQLVEAGLWAHMSVGDVVCNFGFVPPVPGEEENSLHLNGGGGMAKAKAKAAGAVSGSSTAERDHRRWLVFTGDRLAVYHPARAAPIDGRSGSGNGNGSNGSGSGTGGGVERGALTLPTPFYYAHILAGGGGGGVGVSTAAANPRFRLKMPDVGRVVGASATTTAASTGAGGGAVNGSGSYFLYEPEGSRMGVEWALVPYVAVVGCSARSPRPLSAPSPPASGSSAPAARRGSANANVGGMSGLSNGSENSNSNSNTQQRVRVRTYMWTVTVPAEVVVRALGLHSGSGNGNGNGNGNSDGGNGDGGNGGGTSAGVGAGWVGTWTIQAPGTPEGRSALERALGFSFSSSSSSSSSAAAATNVRKGEFEYEYGGRELEAFGWDNLNGKHENGFGYESENGYGYGDEYEYEIVSEKSGGGRVWFRCVSFFLFFLFL